MSHDELLQLSETEQDAYYESLHSSIDLNPMLTEVYEQQESEDRRTQMLEEDWESGSQSYSEDVEITDKTRQSQYIRYAYSLKQ